MLKRLNFELVHVVNCYQLQFSGNSTYHQVVILCLIPCLNSEILTYDQKVQGCVLLKAPLSVVGIVE
jgi:hypothetical protein